MSNSNQLASFNKSNTHMEVIKRNGRSEPVSFDKIIERIRGLCWGLDKKWIDPIDIAKNTINSLYNGISTEEIDFVSADICASQIINHPDFNKLAARLCISNLHKTTNAKFSEVMKQLYENLDVNGNSFPLISDKLYEISQKHSDVIQNKIDFSRDYYINFFGMKTLERSYLMRLKNIQGKNIIQDSENKLRKKYGKIVERPQHLFMRVAIGIHEDDLEKAFETYDLMSNKYFTHATPTMFNSGTPQPQMSSCYLLGMSDSIKGIFKTVADAAEISKWAGGIGIHISEIRSSGSIIRGTNGNSDGIIPLCRMLSMLAKYVNQGGKRNGSIAVYTEPWHADIWAFCELRRNTGEEELRARDLFLALWIPDLFMERVENDEMWSLMCPDECPGLTDAYGQKFRDLYTKYESEKKYKKQIKARDLWHHILISQIETGMPYMTYKDHVNEKTNQKNLGTIKSSNLCVDGDTSIITKDGIYKISELVNRDVEIWNGFEFSKVTVKKTGTNKSLHKINFSNGEELLCTPEHKFYININNKSIEIISDNLENNMEIINFTFPIINGTSEFNRQQNNPYEHGLICSDTYNVNSENKVMEKLYVNVDYNPPTECSINIKMNWLSGYLKNAEYNSNSIYIRACDKDYLIKVKRLINTLGSDCYIENYDPAQNYGMNIQCYRLAFTYNNYKKLLDNGLKSDIIIERMIDTNQSIKIESIEKNYTISDTYCFTELKKHLGVFNSIVTGQCSEIMEYSDENNYAVCNLASICLPRFLEEIDGKLVYNYKKLYEVSRIATYNLNMIIDRNFYPVPETKKTNMENRPVGLGVQGLADVYNKLHLPFGSTEAREINRKIFETIYFGAMTESNELAKKYGPYQSYQGSPISKGLFQFDLWGLDKSKLLMDWDWEGLRQNILTYGVRNSLVTAIMPTASTSQIMGNVECIEPYTTNMFVRTTIAGEYTVINENLVEHLLSRGLWTKEIQNEIVFDGGSIQNINDIDDYTKQVYETAFEMEQVHIVNQSIERGPFIDQSQSQNIFLKDPDFMKLTKCHFYGWKHGLKTGLYYLRSQPAIDPIKFGLDPLVIKAIKAKRGITTDEKYDDSIVDLDFINADDPRRTNDIEISLNQKPARVNRFQRPGNIEECTMCSG